MENPLYKMMIANARRQIDSQNPLKPKEDDFDIFRISEVLAMVLCKRKEDVILDITHCDPNKN